MSAAYFAHTPGSPVSAADKLQTRRSSRNCQRLLLARFREMNLDQGMKKPRPVSELQVFLSGWRSVFSLKFGTFWSPQSTVWIWLRPVVQSIFAYFFACGSALIPHCKFLNMCFFLYVMMMKWCWLDLRFYIHVSCPTWYINKSKFGSFPLQNRVLLKNKS